MSVQIATVTSSNNKIDGEVVETKKIGGRDVVVCCPGCGQEDVGTTVIQKVILISGHINRNCPYNGERIVLLPMGSDAVGRVQ